MRSSIFTTLTTALAALLLSGCAHLKLFQPQQTDTLSDQAVKNEADDHDDPEHPPWPYPE